MIKIDNDSKFGEFLQLLIKNIDEEKLLIENLILRSESIKSVFKETKNVNTTFEIFKELFKDEFDVEFSNGYEPDFYLKFLTCNELLGNDEEVKQIINLFINGDLENDVPKEAKESFLFTIEVISSCLKTNLKCNNLEFWIENLAKFLSNRTYEMIQVYKVYFIGIVKPVSIAILENENSTILSLFSDFTYYEWFSYGGEEAYLESTIYERLQVKAPEFADLIRRLILIFQSL